MTLFEPATGEPVDRVFSLEGSGRPYVMDAWSGRITPDRRLHLRRRTCGRAHPAFT